MKKLTAALLAAMLVVTFSACGNGQSGQSTSIDSTNATGAAPAQYSEGTPDTRVDTTMHQHDAMMKDTIRMKDTISGAQQRTLPQNSPQGNGANTSNTTDKRTTSGSANNGDADKDRKK